MSSTETLKVLCQQAERVVVTNKMVRETAMPTRVWSTNAVSRLRTRGEKAAVVGRDVRVVPLTFTEENLSSTGTSVVSMFDKRQIARPRPGGGNVHHEELDVSVSFVHTSPAVWK
uniref:Uncharacterized protein n=1 Tax=Hyaloperonospora arabidopsidis (strain Emoy2) TaxID=559515 RepID=M4BTH4_HYAAE